MAKREDDIKRYKGRPELEAVEPRLLFSGGLEGVLAFGQLDTSAEESPQTVIEQTLDQASTESTESADAEVRTELIFVDSDVPEYQALLTDLLSYPDETTDYRIFELDNTQDGLAQITAILSSYGDVDAIHILSHGTEGAIDLGGSTLDNDYLAANAELVRSWGDALSPDADLLIYGCNLAGSAEGQLLVNSLAMLTGADVAASEDLTGNAQLGGDWDLEYQVGSVETLTLGAAGAVEDWQGLLDITSGLILHNTFETDASDSSGNNYDGTLTNGALIDTNTGTNQIGDGKVSLDGGNDYVDMSAHVGNFQSLTEGTIATWFKADSLKYGVVFEASDSGDYDSRLAIGANADGSLTLYINEGSTTQLYASTAPGVYSAGSWTHVALTVDGTGNKLYVNGVEQTLSYANGTTATSSFFANVTSLDYMGWGADKYNGTAFTGYFDGMLDDGRIYDRALTAADITELYNYTGQFAAIDDSVSTAEDTPLIIDPTANDTGQVTLIEYTQPANGSVVDNGDGTLTYTPDAGYTGADSFDYVIADADANITLSHYWSLDGSAEDGVGTLDGTLNGTTTVSGSIGNGLSFNESGDYVQMPDVTYGSEFTISFDFRLDDNTGSLFQYLYSHGDINTTNSVNIFINESSHGTDPNVMRTVIRDADDTLDNYALQFDISGIVGDGQWHTYTATVGPGGIEVFLDGVSRASDPTHGTGGVNPTGSLYLGTRQDFDPSRYFGGSMDSLRIYDSALTTSQVSTLADSSVGTVNITVNAANQAPLANDDSASTGENTPLTVAADGVLANDTDADTAPATTAGYTLNYDADSGGTATWADDTAVAGFDWSFDNFGTETQYNTSTSSAYDGITSSYEFSGTNSGAQTSSPINLSGSPQYSSASFEVWFRTDTLTGQHIVMEAGGELNGFSLYLDDSTLKLAVVSNSNPVADEVSVDLATLYTDPTAEFIQAVAVIDLESNQLLLYIDGTLQASTALTNGNGSPWSGSDSFGLGKSTSDVVPNPAAGSGNLDGEIAIVRMYESVLTDTQIDTNFHSVAGNALRVTEVEGGAVNVGSEVTLASGALLTMNADGSYSYDPNGQFDYLAAGDSTTDSFTYTVADIDGGSDTAVVTITINGVNDAPTGIITDMDAGAEVIANNYTTGDQTNPAIAAFADGSYIVVWQSAGQDGSATGIYAQRFAADGTALGSEFQVNVETVDGESQPAVATFADGGFVIAWQDVVAGSHAWVEARVYNADGTAATGEFVLKTGVVDGTNEAYRPTIAVLDDSRFVAVWNGENASVKTMEGAIFDRAGTNLSGTFTVGTLQGNYGQWSGQPEVIALAGGGFAVSWYDDDGSGTNPVSRLAFFDTNGNPVGSEIVLGGDGQTDLAQLADGNVVVVYGDGGNISARLFTSSGSALGGEFQVNTGTTGIQAQPTVTALADGGFYVAWQSDVGDSDGYGILGQRFDASGTPVAGECLLNQTETGDQTLVELVTLADGSVRAVWSSTAQDLSGETIVVRQIDVGGYVYENAPNGTFVGMVTDVIDADAGDTHTFSLMDDAGGAFAIDPVSGQITVADGSLIDYESAATLDITIRVTDAGGLSCDKTLTVQVLDANDAPVITSGSGTTAAVSIAENTASVTTVTATDEDLDTLNYSITGGTDAALFSIDSATGELSFIAAPDYEMPADANGDNVYEVTVQVSDGKGGFDIQAISVTVTDANEAPTDLELGLIAGSDTQVNTTTTQGQYEGEVAALADGGYVVVWTSFDQDGDVQGIYAQRYGADGIKVGGEFQVNTTTTGGQYQPAVAGTADGGFVIAWVSGHDGSTGVYAQAFDSSGNPVGGEFQVPTTTADTQQYPQIAAFDGGGYIITWTSSNQDGSGTGIYAQRFDAAHNPVGSETLINTYTTYDQKSSHVATFADGSWVIVWESWNQDGEYNGVYGQRFDSNGTPNGGEFLVNTTVLGSQFQPQVTVLASGGFAVSWFDAGEISTRVYAADGNPLTGEIAVNTYTAGQQDYPAIVALPDGGFLIAWNSDLQDGDLDGVYAQRFDANGNTVGGEFRLSDATAGNQQYCAMTALDDGRVVAVWSSPDASFSGIYSKILSFGYVTENAVNGTVVGTVQVTDADAGDTHTFQITADSSGGAFQIDYNTGEVTVADGSRLDFEAASSHTITVQVTDSGGQTYSEILSIAVADVNEAPSSVSLSNSSVDEHTDTTAGYSIGALTGSDPDAGDAVTYSIVGGADAALFSIGGAGADDLILTDGLLDYETQSSYEVTVRATDSGGLTYDRTFIVTVNDLNDVPVGVPVITGTAEEGQTLTVDTSGISDADGMGVFSYQWYADGVAIVGATGGTCTLTQNEVGTVITVVVSYIDGQGTAESVSSVPTAVVTNVNNPVAGQPVITGTPTEDQVLAADTSGISDTDGLGVFSYQWYRDGVAIAGATASTYGLVDADVGANITVTVSYTDGQGTPESTSSNPIGPVANVNDAPTGADATLSATEDVDYVFSLADFGFSDVDGDTFDRVWITTLPDQGTLKWNGSAFAAGNYVMADDINLGLLIWTPPAGVSGTSLTSFIFQVQDDGGTANGGIDTDPTPNTITFNVTPVNDPVSGQPVITGTPTEDQTLIADTSGISDADGLGAFSYQWYRDGVAVAGATGNSYTLGDADVAASITVTVSYTDGQGTVETTTSNPVGPVVNVNDVPSGSVTIDNTSPAEGDMLTASNTLTDADGLSGPVSYQWYADGMAIAGATGSTYTLTQAEVGAVITVVASYTDDQGTAESVSSAGTAAVTNVNNPVAGQPVITGTPTEDQVLTADTSAISDVDGLGAFSYQWYRDGVVIAGATNSTYMLGDADVGTNITVTVGYTDAYGTPESTTSSPVGPVANVNDTPVIDIDADDSGGINGTDYSITFTENGAYTNITDIDATISDIDSPTLQSMTITVTNFVSGEDSLAWSTGGTAISATSGVVGGQLVVTFTGTDTVANYQQVLNSLQYRNFSDTPDTTDRVITFVVNDGNDDSNVATTTVTIISVNDTPAGVPVITGTVEEDQTLTADTSGISDADGLGTFGYQWYRDGVAIAGATASTYTLGDADVGAQMSVSVSYTDSQGTTEGPLTSTPTAAVVNVNDTPTGSVTINNLTPAEGDTLTASNTLADADGLTGPVSYQWYADGVAIGGATGTTYTLTQAEVGAVITVVASYTDDQGTAESVSSAGTAAVTNVNNPVAGQPVITGTPTEDQTLTADTSGISDVDGLGTFSYQWYRDGVAIAGATASAYTLGDADVGANVTVTVSYTDGQGAPEATTSNPVGPVANVNDTPAGVPVITGTVEEDQILTADTSGISDADGLGVFSYQWYRDGVAIAGATASTYTMGDTDVGAQMSVSVSYTDGQGTSESATSNPVGPVANVNDTPAGVPVITGTVEEDQTLTADTSGISDADGLGTFGYQWYRDGVAIAGATASTYTLGDADVGAQMSVSVSYTDSQGTAEGPLTSASTTAVVNVNDAPIGSVTIDNLTPAEGDTLTASNTLADADGLSGPVNYQWYADGVTIAGATGSTYTLTQAEVGAVITVVASYTDDQGTAESVSSAGTAVVTNVNNPVAGQPVITGTPTENQTLTADTSGIGDVDGLGTFSYQWYRDGVAIAGAIGSGYTLGDADVGTNITVTVSYTDGYGTAESTTSNPVGPIANINDAPVGVPVITGSVQEDQTLTADTSGISDADGLGAFSYQWYRDGVAITGATSSTYALGDADVGAQMSVSVSYTDSQGTAEGPLTSASTAAVANINDAPTGSVTIDNLSPAEGDILTAGNTLADADGLSGPVSYQWYADGVAIAGATGSTCTLTQAEVGTVITVVASYTDDQGTAESVSSAGTAAVTNVNNAPTGSVTISGSATEDQVLTASNTLSDVDGMGPVSYQWYRDGVAIVGATGSSYSLSDADVGASITVVASYTDGQGTGESMSSAGVGPVASVNDTPVGSPVITGTVEEDQTLTADISGISDADGLGVFGYQWYRDGVAIAGATSSTYTLADADVDAVITVQVSYIDGQGYNESLTSVGVGPVLNVNDTPTGSVTIDNLTPAEGDTLTAGNTLADADGLSGPVSYQWYADGVAIAGATGSTCTLTQAEVGTVITVVASYTDDQGTAESVGSTGTAAVTNVNNPVAGNPVITGTPTEDQVLTADVSGISDVDGLGSLVYQWYRDGVAIGGATGGTYTLGDADVGASITVQVSYTDGYGTPESTTSAAAGPVNGINDVPVGSPVVTGTVQEDQVLTADITAISDADGLGAFSYQWYRDGVAIAGATGSTYTLGDTDVGSNIAVQVSYTDGQGNGESLTSATVGPVMNINDIPAGVPVINGIAAEDQILTVDTTGITDADGLSAAFSFQWYRDGVVIPGANGGGYVLGDADVGAIITVTVSYVDDQGTAESITSTGAGPVANVNDAPTGSVTIDNMSPAEGDTLTAGNTLADADGLSGPVSYQWYADGVAIPGATGLTYTLTQNDVGAVITVVASYTDDQGTAESVSSAGTAAVANVNNPVVGQPVISGTPTEDQMLTADVSGISDVDGLGAFSYQWYRDGVAIGGATASSYTLGDADVGTNLTVTVSYVDGYGAAESTTSNPVGPVANVNDAPTGAVTIDKLSPVEGETLIAGNTLVDADGLSGPISYQWYRDGMAIAGATGGSYTLTRNDVGAVITVVASYVDDQGNSESVSSKGATVTGVFVETEEDVPETEVVQDEAVDSIVLEAVIEDDDPGPGRAQIILEKTVAETAVEARDDEFRVDSYEYFEEYGVGMETPRDGVFRHAVQNIVRAGVEMTEDVLQLFDLVRIKISEIDDQPTSGMVKSVGGLALSLSAGFVSWVLRGGALAASMLSSVTVLRGFDPLPVMDMKQRRHGMAGRTDEDAEEVDDMFEDAGRHDKPESPATGVETDK